MRILLGLRRDVCRGEVVQTYSQSFKRELESLGHQVTEVGPGTKYLSLNDIPFNLGHFDALIDLECGRAQDGTFSYQIPSFRGNSNDLPPSAIWFIDSHGNPTLHKRTAPFYKHVFYAVWAKSDLFYDHPSAHWCPNATDLKWFNPAPVNNSDIAGIDFGFFGSKKGLARAEPMKKICEKRGWSYNIRQINGVYKHRWPYTAEAMKHCRFLFNHSQKHDSPNLRVLESMAVGRPLICDYDPKSGMDKLFLRGYHYIPYDTGTYKDLEAAMDYCMNGFAEETSHKALNEVTQNHLICHRVNQILEVLHA